MQNEYNDSFENIMPLLQAKSVNLIIADFPYGTTKCKWDKLVDFNHSGYDSTERYPLSVQVFASDKQKSNLNPTQKPESLIEYFVKTYTNEGDTVLDPCRGSNTTGVVCDRLNRGYTGIEKDLEQFNKGLERRKNALL